MFGETALTWLAAEGLPARLVAADGAILRLNGWPEPAAPEDPGRPNDARADSVP